MGIRRRRKKLNTVLTSVDRRLRQVELRRVPKIVKDGTITRAKLSADLKAIVDKSEETNKVVDTTGSGTVAPTFVEKPYVNVVKVEYRGYNLDNLDDDAATVYFDVDPGINIGDTIKLAGFTPLLDKPGKTTNYVVTASGLFNSMYYIRYLPGRQEIQRSALTLDKGVRILSANCGVADATVNGGTTTYKSGTITYAGAASTDSDVVNGPVWPGGTYVTTGSRFTDYEYEIGDLLNLDGLGDPFDGPHLVTGKTVNGSDVTLKFSFATPQVGPVTLPTTNGSLRGAVARLLRNGETYTDTSIEPAVTYVWDEALQKWWNMADNTLPENLVTDDGIAPKPPTSVTGTSEGYVSGGPKSSVSLSWTAPTLNANNTTLVDLSGYKVYYKYASATGAYTFAADVKVTSAKLMGLPSDVPIKVVVTAYDKTKNESAYSTEFAITTAKGALTLDVLSAPTVASRLGNITITWDGKSSLGATMSGSEDLDQIEVYRGTSATFIPDPANYVGKFSKGLFSYIDSKVDYGVTYYYKIIPTDFFGNKAAASAASAGIAPAKLVDTDVVANTLTTWPFLGQVVSADALADGSVSGSALAANAITASNINSVFEADAVRVNIGSFGGLGADEIAAGAIVAGKLAVGAVTAGTIAAEAVEAGNIKANSITADQIDAGYVYAGVIEAGQISAGTLTGFTMQTSATGNAVVLNGDENAISFRIGTTYTSHLLPNYDDGLLIHYGAAPDETGATFPRFLLDAGGFTITADDNYQNTIDIRLGGLYLKGDRIDVFGTLYTNSLVSDGSITAATGLTHTGLAGASTTAAYININGSITRTASSQRYKQDIADLDFVYEDILKLQPRTFRLKEEAELLETSRHYAGFIAEEIAQIPSLDIFVAYEHLAETGVTRPDSVFYAEMTTALLAAIKHQHNMIQSLSDRIATLEA